MQVTRRLILQKARHQATAEAATPFDCLWARGFRYYFTPLPGCFSPFPHGTSSLSVTEEYLALRDGPRGFRPGFPCPAVLRYSSRKSVRFRLQGHYLLWRDFPFTSANARICNFPTRRQTDQDEPYNPRTTTTAVYHVARVWALPLSLATTQGVEVSFLSSGYLDVSVPQLASTQAMYSPTGTRALPRVSFLIRKSWDQ